MTYSSEFKQRRNEQGDPDKAHLIQGGKLPPDGEANWSGEMEDEEGVLRQSLGFDAVGLSYPSGQDFGPYVQRCGEGLSPDLMRFPELRNDIPFSAGNVHPHTGMLLFSHVLNQRPKAIIETGTFYGYSTWFMAEALRVWGDGGKVYTIDPNMSLVSKEIKEHPNVELITGTSQEKLPELLKALGEVQFCFLDSYKRIVYSEFQMCLPYIPEGGIACFHDTQFLNTGRMLYSVLKQHPDYTDWEFMLHCGKPHKENGHKFFGNADDRGFLVCRKMEAGPFLNVWDANSRFMEKGKEAAIATLPNMEN